MLDPTQPLDLANIVRGWKEIGAELGGVSEDTAQRWASREVDPLPVYEDHLGIGAHRSALREWMIRQRRSYLQRITERRSAAKRGKLRHRSRNT